MELFSFSIEEVLEKFGKCFLKTRIDPYHNIAREDSEKSSAKILPQFIKTAIY